MKKSLFFVFLSVLSVVFHAASASSWVKTGNYCTIPKENVVLQSAAYNYRLCKDVNFSDLTINGETMGVYALTFDTSITTDEIKYNGYIPYQCSVEGLENLWCAMTTPNYTAGCGLQTNGSGPRGLLLGKMKKDQIIVFEGANGGYNTGETDLSYNGFCIPNGSRYSGETGWTWELFDPLQVEDISTEIHTEQNEIVGGDAYGKYLYLRVLQDGWVSIPMERSAWIYGYQIWDKAETGDVNGDGKVTIADVVAVVNYILGNASAGFASAAADVNGDGKTTITDVVAIVNLILRQDGSAKMRGAAKELDPQ